MIKTLTHIAIVKMNSFVMRFIVFFVLSIGICSAIELFTCSRSCNRRPLNRRALKIKRAAVSDTPAMYPCSCSVSCSWFGDCCEDSKFRQHDNEKPPVLPTCLPLYGYGHFTAITKCPSNWDQSSEYCENGLGNLPPVTSRKTGATYSNFFCAMCNNDADRIITWNAQTECCSFVDLSDDNKEGKYIHLNDSLWRVFMDENKSLKFCQCTLKLDKDPKAFLEQVRVRSCDMKSIDTCSMTWMDKETADACKSYLDPVFIGDKLYRNKHCATCNHERMDGRDFLCVPSAMNHLLGRSWSHSEAYDYCKQQNLTACLDFLNNSRGKRKSFYEIFMAAKQQCTPREGHKCCDGFLYDSRRDRCRKIAD